MASLVLTNAYVSVNSVDLSDRVRKVTIDYGAELQDDTTMGDTTREKKPGLLDWTITVEYAQDFAASKVDATHFSLVGAAAFTIEVRPVNASRSATNPGFNGSCVIESYPILGNGVGELATTTVVYKSAGALSRSTS